jgi:hypothetical protein
MKRRRAGLPGGEERFFVVGRAARRFAPEPGFCYLAFRPLIKRKILFERKFLSADGQTMLNCIRFEMVIPAVFCLPSSPVPPVAA